MYPIPPWIWRALSTIRSRHSEVNILAIAPSRVTRDPAPAMIEVLHGGGESLSLAAEEVFSRDDHVFKNQLRGRRPPDPHLVVHRPDLEAGHRRLHDQRRYPSLLAFLA